MKTRKKAAKKLEIPGNWTFRTPAVASAFDAHVRESLPWYDFVTGAVAHFARAYIPDGGYVIDVGASTGNIARALAATLDQRRAYLIAIDNSPDMVKLFDKFIRSSPTFAGSVMGGEVSFAGLRDRQITL